MPEITKPLYVQYTGDKTRINCCTECIKLLDEDGFVIDRKGELFSKVDENGKDQLGQKARVRYILGRCDGVSITCVGNCYWVNILRGEGFLSDNEFIYKNIDQEICNQDPPFSEDDPEKLRNVEDRLKVLKVILSNEIDILKKTIESQQTKEQEVLAYGKQYNRHIAFKKKLSTQTNSAEAIARNKKAINERMIEIQKEISKIKDEVITLKFRTIVLPSQAKDILNEEYNFLQNLLVPKNSTPKIFESIRNIRDDSFRPIILPNVATINASMGGKIISGSINTFDSFKIQNFTIDTTGANPESGTTNVVLENIVDADIFVTSATYNNASGIIDFTWNQEPEISVRENYALKMDSRSINFDENAVQLELHEQSADFFVSENNIGNLFENILKQEQDLSDKIKRDNDRIKDLQDEIIKTDLELFIKNNVSNTIDQNTFNDVLDTIDQYARYARLALKRFAQ